MNELKQRVSRGDYAVDPGQVADSLVTKIKLLHLGKKLLVSAADAHTHRRLGQRH